MSTATRLAVIIFLLVSLAVIAAQSRPPADNVSAEVAKGDWASYDRDYLGDRYSPLDEIKVENVKRIQPLCTYNSGVKNQLRNRSCGDSRNTVLRHARCHIRD